MIDGACRRSLPRRGRRAARLSIAFRERIAWGRDRLEGYPGRGTSGLPIAGLREAEDVDTSGVSRRHDAQQSVRRRHPGGRVLTVVGRGCTFEQALGRATRVCADPLRRHSIAGTSAGSLPGCTMP